MIIVGTLLLMLPFATKGEGGASFFDALFTSTSAVCVTGLVVQDTATYWSLFGQFVIMLLIQTGGLGIVTVAISVTVISGKKIGLMQRSTMQETVSAHNLGGIVRLTKFILKTTVIIELAGAVLLLPFFIRDFGVWRGIWYALFHSVSAFCNAGFDLMGVNSPFSSLTSYSGEAIVNIVISLLIIIGGIGFLTWDDIRNHKFRIRKYRMQSKVILSVSAILILLPAIYFFFFEYSSLPLGKRILTSLFQSVTTRTAGFNTTDLSAFSETGRMMMIVLMLIGGSPGSTAGGMKTTTVAVLIAAMVSVARKKESAHLFKRRISDDVVKYAATLAVLYVILFIGGGMIISRVEGLPLLSAMFETASAIGTVGLTLGITTSLGTVSRIILIILMFFGRVGGLTLIFAATGSGVHRSEYPQEKIMVG